MIDSSAQVICIAHEIETFNNEKNMIHLAPFAKSNRLSLVTLVEHATRKVKENIQVWAQQDEAWRDIPVYDFVPASRP